MQRSKSDGLQKIQGGNLAGIQPLCKDIVPIRKQLQCHTHLSQMMKNDFLCYQLLPSKTDMVTIEGSATGLSCAYEISKSTKDFKISSKISDFTWRFQACCPGYKSQLYMQVHFPD